jgi:hypothetical protein
MTLENMLMETYKMLTSEFKKEIFSCCGALKWYGSIENGPNFHQR